MSRNVSWYPVFAAFLVSAALPMAPHCLSGQTTIITNGAVQTTGNFTYSRSPNLRQSNYGRRSVSAQGNSFDTRFRSNLQPRSYGPSNLQVQTYGNSYGSSSLQPRVYGPSNLRQSNNLQTRQYPNSQLGPTNANLPYGSRPITTTVNPDGSVVTQYGDYGPFGQQYSDPSLAQQAVADDQSLQGAGQPDNLTGNYGYSTDLTRPGARYYTSRVASSFRRQPIPKVSSIRDNFFDAETARVDFDARRNLEQGQAIDSDIEERRKQFLAHVDQIQQQLSDEAQDFFTESWFDARKSTSDITKPAFEKGERSLWRTPSWPEVASWVNVPPEFPAIVDFGTNLYYDGESVYLNDVNIGTGEEFVTRAFGIADKGATVDISMDDQWLPLGVFALGSEGNPIPALFLELQLSHAGHVRGFIFNRLTDEVQPVRGSTDLDRQRITWTWGTSNNTILDTTLANSTEKAFPVLIHFGRKKTKKWIMVRLESPESAAPTTPPQDSPL